MTGFEFRIAGIHRLRRGAATACFLALALAATGARGDGVAILKEQPYHRDVSAKAVSYQRMSVHGPYLRIVTFRGNLDVMRSKMVDCIDLPGPPPPFLMEQGDLRPLNQSLSLMRRFASRYPASASLLQPEIDVLAGYVSRFAAGDVRFEGRWIAKNALADFLETQRRGEAAHRRLEIEEVVADEARQDMGLVQVNGEWVSKDKADEHSPAASTELSATLWPLMNPELEGARMALKNLGDLADGQKGSAKVRTERLQKVIRNLFLAEFRLARETIAAAASEVRAAKQDQQAEQWLKPNAFGTQRKVPARESLAKARQIRLEAAQALEARRSELLGQLREADIVTDDFHKLREHRVALILGETVRAVAARWFDASEFQSAFPDQTLTTIRGEIATGK